MWMAVPLMGTLEVHALVFGPPLALASAPVVVLALMACAMEVDGGS